LKFTPVLLFSGMGNMVDLHYEREIKKWFYKTSAGLVHEKSKV